MIEATDIHKRFKNVEALNGISFSVADNEIFGVIGPDGSGKTTLFRILASLMLPDSGAATLNGLNVIKHYKKIRHIIGYMPGRFSLYQDLSVEENLNFFATVYHTSVKKNYHFIEAIYRQLEPFKKRRAGALSGGMKQKLALCCALIHKPEILILDEPTTGVDPVSRKEFWDMLAELKQHNITILVSTAYMDEARLCDRIALMRNGNFIATDTPQGIINSFSHTLWAVKTERMSASLKTIRSHPKVNTCYAFGDTHHVTCYHDFTTDELARYLHQQGYDFVRITPVAPTVEDCFMAMAVVD